MLVAALVILSGLAVISAAYVLAALWERQQQFSAAREFNQLIAIHAATGLDGLTAEIRRRSSRPPSVGLLQQLYSADHIYVLARGDSERALVGNLAFWPTGLTTLASGQIVFSAPRIGLHASELHQIQASTATLPGGERLLVGRDVEFVERISHWLEGAPVWLLVFGMLSGTLGGWVVSRRMLGRIDQIRDGAEQIMAGDTSHRMPVSAKDDEFDRLSATLNRMLSEIEELMQTIRRVTNDIAHDLRSPLTRIRQQLEVVRNADDAATMREAAVDSVIEIDRMVATFNAMLTIAAVGSGTVPVDLEPVSLDEVLRDLEDLYRPMSDERAQAFSVERGHALSVRANRELLFRALANLTENAIKYAPPGGRVEVAARPRGTAVEVIVADNGPGIPEADRDRVLQPFVRLDQSRSEPGNGLGLALVAAVGKLHRAALVLADNGPGLRVSLVLPAAH